LLARFQLDPFLKRIVTGDEKWVLYVNVTRKRQWLSPTKKPVPTPKPGLHPKKVLLCVWWDMDGLIYYELLNQNQTITADVYCQQLDKLRLSLATKRPALANRKGVILQQDNARPHTAKITQQKLKEFGWEILPHPPYSPDIAPSDYHLFQSLQHFLDGKEFKGKNEVENAINSYFTQKSKDFFRDGIEKLPEGWSKIIENDGNYIID
jgi:[histone H3]-lysine36 N-dimethyltransferase SETMAR